MSDEEAREAGFVIDGRDYDIPTIDSLNMDESCVLYDYAGLALDDFAVDEDDDDAVAEVSRKLRNPAFVKALLHIAYQRGNPDAKPATVEKLVGTVKLMEAMERMVREVADADSPPELAPSATETDGSSGSSNVDSGIGSPTSSDGPAVVRLPTGTTGSDTSPTLDLTALVR